jgi:hypothetical protein
MMPDHDQDQRDLNRDMKYEIEGLHKDVAVLQKALDSLQKDRESAMKWSFIVLGTAVIGLLTWIFNFVMQVHK